MTFTYTPAAPTDITRVRYHIGDTVEDTAIFSDEEIQFAIDEETDWKGAVIASIRSIIARLAGEPDMTADWLRIDWRRSADSWLKLLDEKKQQFGLGAIASSGNTHVWRPDSRLKDAPEYEDSV